ncbi:glycosyltransferase [Conexibacter sp. SYSU D00693]|uniref:glycosyltransferase n=1 Tax=Conexibacter sp. SYSU D00693 TaxID=2812560 RepID=UPI00196B0901|nr:glycosyltransferase [Conexibacter sp. SYSU D00693]
MCAVEALSIAHVSPFTWEERHEVGTYVREVTARLAARGHQVTVLAPSRDGAAVKEVRAAVRAGRFEALAGRPFLPVSEALEVPVASRTRAALPVDAARTIEELLTALPLDVVHVHEPFAPSVSSTALRNSRALTVGTFHAPAERLVATQVARKLTKLVFGRLDARHAAFGATAQLLERFFGGHYAVVGPGTDAPASRLHPDDGPLRLAFVDGEERAALRTFLRALRRLPRELDFTATVVSPRGPSTSTPLRADLRERVTFAEDGEQEALEGADVVVLASDGDRPAPALLLRALAAGAVPVASRLPVYEELAQDAGLLFEPRDSETLAAQLARLADPDLRAARRAAAPPPRSWDDVCDDVEASYAALVARRHDAEGDGRLWQSLAPRRTIDVDLHMHTDHSPDCATPVEHLLATARDQGLGAIAVTDHNEVSGAFEALEKAEAYGVKVIVGEEVKTATQGEVIGLFLQEKIPRGLSLRETVDAIRAQGGLVYVPHPFDRMHAVPDYEHLQTILDDVDAIEVYNPRVAIGSFNEEAERFAAKYRIVRGAGSDSHVAAGLGTVRVRMRDFDGPEEFLESLRHAEIITKSGTLLYVQALKFLETKATPPAARRARRERRVRRATRNG